MNESTDKFISIDGYNLLTNNTKNKKGSGMAILIKSHINYILCPELSYNINNEFETIFVKVKNKVDSILVGEIYRPPGTNEKLKI